MTETVISNSHFTNLARFNIDNIVKGNYYTLNSSKLTVLIAEHDSPIISAYFCIATKVEDDDGLPHTLEHLVFTGSKRYPYRGVLDLLANRCLAQGTNAWTAIDHTCYTISTASEQGFLNILPVYMDHIFNPVYDEDEFLTEVYHTTPTGEDAGIVFSEMQSRENTETKLTYRKMMKTIFEETSNYIYESGGKMENIRKLTLEQIKKYHSKYYMPSNCCLIIVGAVQPEKFFKEMIEIEETVLKRFQSCPHIERPWVDEKIFNREAQTQLVEFPSFDEVNGSVIISFTGPKIDKQIDIVALNIVLSYLCCNNSSPLQEQFINRPDPLCYNLYYDFIKFGAIYPLIHFTSVKVEYMDILIERFKSIIINITEGSGFNEELLKKTIIKEYLNVIDDFENNVHNKIAEKAISYFLYGKRNVDLFESMSEMSVYRRLLKQDPSFWKDFLLRYFDMNSLKIVKGIPSRQLREDINSESKALIEKFNTNTDSDMKEKIRQKILKAEEKSKLKAPVGLLEQFALPDMDQINLHHIKTFFNFGNFDFDQISLYDFELINVPLAMQIDHIQSNFVQINLCICLKELSQTFLSYLPILSCLPFEMPIRRNGILLSHEDAQKQLENISVYFGGSVGYNGSSFLPGTLPQYYFISIKTIIDYYEEAVSWMHDLCFGFCCDADRLIILVNQLIDSARQSLECGPNAVYGLSQMITFRKSSLFHISSCFVQLPFLKELRRKLKETPDQVVETINNIANHLRMNTNINAHLACDFEKLGSFYKYPHSVWQLSFSENSYYSSKTPHTPSNFNSDKLEDGVRCHKIVAIPSADSSYLHQTLPCLRSYRDPDYAALKVLLEYLGGFEGPLWKGLRGKGLAYNFSVYAEPCDGIVNLNISRSVDIVRAYEETINIIKHISSGEYEFTKNKLETAISGVIYSVVNDEKTVCDAGSQSLLAQLKGLNSQFHKDLIINVSKVTQEDMSSVAKKYLINLTKPEQNFLAISCPEDKIEYCITGFNSMGIILDEYPLKKMLKKQKTIQ